MSAPIVQAEAIPESHRDLLEQPIVTSLATTLSDGTPQVTPVWFNYEDGHIFFNSARGRLKDRAIREHPYVAMTMIDPNNPYRYIAIRGPVVEITEEGAREHINFLSNRYTGRETYPGPTDEQRVKYVVVPEHVATMG
ncbi:MAG: TIGR03618 family F420-dependent PPOX class oxidoreductase [Ardenticatenales bacterium]|nr:TIGR03618 family F420-dependent PPOX class oxidoreductase [Ardenticatenales bacterium]